MRSPFYSRFNSDLSSFSSPQLLFWTLPYLWLEKNDKGFQYYRLGTGIHVSPKASRSKSCPYLPANFDSTLSSRNHLNYDKNRKLGLSGWFGWNIWIFILAKIICYKYDECSSHCHANLKRHILLYSCSMLIFVPIFVWNCSFIWKRVSVPCRTQWNAHQDINNVCGDFAGPWCRKRKSSNLQKQRWTIRWSHWPMICLCFQCGHTASQSDTSQMLYWMLCTKCKLNDKRRETAFYSNFQIIRPPIIDYFYFVLSTFTHFNYCIWNRFKPWQIGQSSAEVHHYIFVSLDMWIESLTANTHTRSAPPHLEREINTTLNLNQRDVPLYYFLNL